MSMMWIGIGTAVVSVVGMAQQKQAIKKDAAFAASQQLGQAQISRGVGNRQAAEERRQSRLLESAIQARAMGGGSDPTVVDLMQDVAGEGEYRALSALYEGETGALGLESAASAGLRSANSRANALNYQMASTALGSASSMYSKYGGDMKTKKG